MYNDILWKILPIFCSHLYDSHLCDNDTDLDGGGGGGGLVTSMHSCLAYLPPFTSFRRTGGSLAVPLPPRQRSPASSPQSTTTTVLPHLLPLRCRTHTDRVFAYRLNIIIVSFPHFAQLSARTSKRCQGSYPFCAAVPFARVFALPASCCTCA